MPYILSWYIEKRIIHDRVSGVFTLDDWRIVHEYNIEQLKVGIAPIHIIIDTRRVEKFDFTLQDFQMVLGKPKEPAMGWFILVGTDTMARFLASFATQLVKTNGRMFSTLEEAVAFLQEVDVTLQKPAVKPRE
jgi:hypothetical protein